MDQTVQVYEGKVPDLFVARDAAAVVKEARKAAEVLVDVISQKPKKVMMNGEQYLEFEDWQIVGKFYGCTAKVKSTTFIKFGEVQGFEAVADVLDRNGNVISSAEAMCLNDEEKWSARTKYRYEDVIDPKTGKKIWVEGKAGQKGHYKSNKIADGEVPVPLFQLRSMAQTRACAKALRNVFSWVVVLAGYKATVAEELDESQAETVETTVEGPKTVAETGGSKTPEQEKPTPETKPEPEKPVVDKGQLIPKVKALAEELAKRFDIPAATIIAECSKFDGKNGPVKSSDLDRMSFAWMKTTYGNMKEMRDKANAPLPEDPGATGDDMSGAV